MDFRGRIYIDGGTGVHGFKAVTNSYAQYPLGSNLISGQIFISLRGNETIGYRFEGASDTRPVMNWFSTGRMWVINDINHYNVTGMSLTYVRGCGFGGYMSERCAVAVEMNYTKNTVIDSFGLVNLPQVDHVIIDERPFFDINAGCYSNTFVNIHVSVSGSRTIWVLDDTQNDANAPNMFDTWTFTQAGGAGNLTATFETNTYFDQDFGSGRWYRRLGSGAVWPTY